MKRIKKFTVKTTTGAGFTRTRVVGIFGALRYIYGIYEEGTIEIKPYKKGDKNNG